MILQNNKKKNIKQTRKKLRDINKQYNIFGCIKIFLQKENFFVYFIQLYKKLESMYTRLLFVL